MPATSPPSATPTAAPAAIPAEHLLSPRTIRYLDEIHNRTRKTFDQIVLDAIEAQLRSLGIARGLHCSKCRRITPHVFIIARPIANTNQQELIYQCSVPDCKRQRRYGTEVMTTL